MIRTNRAPLVSVIIPAFNQGKLLARAIDSALAQSYACKEIIVINDGSPESLTRDTAMLYGNQIIYAERPNGGVAAARNTGIGMAAGELIALLDQDDTWLPEKLRKEVAILLTHADIALVHSSYYLIDEAGNRIALKKLREGVWNPLPDLLLEVPVSSCTTLFRRQTIDDIGPFDPELTGSDDWDLWLRMASRDYRFYCIQEPLAEYRVHSTMTSKDGPMMVRTGLAVLDKFYGATSVPAKAIEWKDRAYFNKHAWATAVYYGSADLREAREHLKSAIGTYPEGVASSRFLRSLISARAEAASVQPTRASALEAVRFVIREATLPLHYRKKVATRGYLLVALHTAGGRMEMARRMALVFVMNPQLVFDREIWATAGRLARSALGSAVGRNGSR